LGIASAQSAIAAYSRIVCAFGLAYVSARLRSGAASCLDLTLHNRSQSRNPRENVRFPCRAFGVAWKPGASNSASQGRCHNLNPLPPAENGSAQAGDGCKRGARPATGVFAGMFFAVSEIYLHVFLLGRPIVPQTELLNGLG
jgi:hypothetical protein